MLWDIDYYLADYGGMRVENSGHEVFEGTLKEAKEYVKKQPTGCSFNYIPSKNKSHGHAIITSTTRDIVQLRAKIRVLTRKLSKLEKLHKLK